MATDPLRSHSSNGHWPRPSSVNSARVAPMSPVTPMDDRSTLRQGGEPQTGVFDAFPDISKLNKERHNALRNDTFKTATPLTRKVAGASGQDASSPIQVQQLMDICELSFAKNLRNLHNTMIEDLKTEINVALGPLKDELSGTVADARGAVAFEDILARLRVLEVPPVDLAPITEEIHKATAEQNRAVEQVKDEFAKDVSRIEARIASSIAQQEQAEGERSQRVTSLEEAVKRSHELLDKVMQLTESLGESASMTAKEVTQISLQTERQGSNLVPCLEDQLGKFVRTTPVNVDFGSVLRAVTVSHKSMSGDLSCLLSEIAKVQQALNVDFVNVLDVKLSEIGRVRSSILGDADRVSEELRRSSQGQGGLQKMAKRRLRDIGSQCTTIETAEVFTQTERLVDQKKKTAEKKKLKDMKAKGTLHKGKADKALFADAESMKAKAREALVQPQYNVSDYYHDTGIIQQIARSATFEQLTFAFIIANAIWIGVDTDMNDATVLLYAKPVFQVADNVFCSFFTIELLIRFCAFKHKLNCFRDTWFVFDLVLVLLMVMETWIITIVVLVTKMDSGGAALGSGSLLRTVRVVKMFRISRMIRFLRSVPEVLIVVKGVTAASRSVGLFLVLWCVIIYIYALLFRQLSEIANVNTRFFGTVPDAMNSLLLDGIFPNYSIFVTEASAESVAFYPLLLTFIILTVLTLKNMLMGVLVEVVSVIASTEKEGMTVLHLATDLRGTMAMYDIDTTEMIQKPLFVRLLTEPEIIRIINGVGVNVELLADMTENIYDDLGKSGADGLSFEGFVDLILNMRGTNPAKVKDIKEQLRLIKGCLREHHESNTKKVSDDMRLIRYDLKELKESEARARGDDPEDSDSEMEAPNSPKDRQSQVED